MERGNRSDSSFFSENCQLSTAELLNAYRFLNSVKRILHEPSEFVNDVQCAVFIVRRSKFHDSLSALKNGRFVCDS